MQEMIGAALIGSVCGIVIGMITAGFTFHAIRRCNENDLAVVVILLSTCLSAIIGVQWHLKHEARMETERLQKMAVEAGLGEYVNQVTASQTVFVIKKPVTEPKGEQE